MAGTTNTADVGCIAACLSIAAPYVDAARRKLYLDAARRYADGYAAQWQLPSGGFTNAQCRGIRSTSEYSVGHPWSNAKAAATPCVLMLYHRQFGKSEALATAIRRAITFLSTPQHQCQVGVMTDPSMPWSRYTVEATGFAGLSLAERVSPGVVFLRSARAQRELAAMARPAE